MWKSYRKQDHTQKKGDYDNKKKFETWVWDEMKKVMKNENPFDMNAYAKYFKRGSFSAETEENENLENM